MLCAALLAAAIEERDPIRDARQASRDERRERAATAVRMYGPRFVQRSSLLRLKSGNPTEMHAKRVGMRDENRSATAIRMYGLRFVRHFVRRYSLRRLKNADCEQDGRPRTGLFTADEQPVIANDRLVTAQPRRSAGVPLIFF